MSFNVMTCNIYFVFCIPGFLSGKTPFMTQTDSTTNLTIGAGFFMVLTTVISPAFKVSKEVTADWSAGMASAKSFSQSSLIVRKIQILGVRE